MADEIIIRVDHSIQDGTNEVESQDAEVNTEATKKKSGDSNVSKAIAVYMGKQALNFAVSNYGNLTGDYLAQANTQSMIELGGLVALALSSPTGAVAAGVGLAIKIANKEIELHKKNLANEQLRMRTGMMTYSGGRT